eukprot:Skav218644  [mRNA]  locus=scaffold365:521862:527343:- [translate_table: standard]
MGGRRQRNLTQDLGLTKSPVYEGWKLLEAGACRDRAIELEHFRAYSRKMNIVAPTPTGESGSTNYSLMGIYLGVVYTIGRFLRQVFQDASQRVIYEEMNDTQLLEDLCSGIYIARITGDLESEYAFYYELIRIYRSPQMLLEISKPKSKLDEAHFRPATNRPVTSSEGAIVTSDGSSAASLRTRPAAGRSSVEE